MEEKYPIQFYMNATIDPIIGVTPEQLIKQCQIIATGIYQFAGMCDLDRGSCINMCVTMVYDSMQRGKCPSYPYQAFAGFLWTTLRNEALKVYNARNAPKNALSDRAAEIDLYVENHYVIDYIDEEGKEEEDIKRKMMLEAIKKLSPEKQAMLQDYFDGTNKYDLSKNHNIKLHKVRAELIRMLNPENVGKPIRIKPRFKKKPDFYSYEKQDGDHQDLKERAEALIEQGFQLSEIASILGCSSRWLNKTFKPAKKPRKKRTSSTGSRMQKIVDFDGSIEYIPKKPFDVERAKALIASGYTREHVCKILKCQNTTLTQHLGKHHQPFDKAKAQALIDEKIHSLNYIAKAIRSTPETIRRHFPLYVPIKKIKEPRIKQPRQIKEPKIREPKEIRLTPEFIEQMKALEAGGISRKEIRKMLKVCNGTIIKALGLKPKIDYVKKIRKPRESKFTLDIEKCKQLQLSGYTRIQIAEIMNCHTNTLLNYLGKLPKKPAKQYIKKVIQTDAELKEQAEKLLASGYNRTNISSILKIGKSRLINILGKVKMPFDKDKVEILLRTNTREEVARLLKCSTNTIIKYFGRVSNENLIKEAKQLFAEGKTRVEIARILNIDRGTVADYINKQ